MTDWCTVAEPTTWPQNAIPVILPVGPAHEPTRALRASVRSSGSASTIHVVVLNSGSSIPPGVSGGSPRDREIWDSAMVVHSADRVGYVKAVRYGLELVRLYQGAVPYVGFLDADAVLRGGDHWEKLSSRLDDTPLLDAVSGLVVHEDARVWETLSSKDLVDTLEAVNRESVRKPYVQGGAGGSLSRWDCFAAAVLAAESSGGLIGPNLSAAAINSGKIAYATSELRCTHTRRLTLQEWVDSVSAYERCWRALVRTYGSGLEKPWLQFLQVVYESLPASRPDLLHRVHLNVLLRGLVARRIGALTPNDESSVVGADDHRSPGASFELLREIARLNEEQQI